MKICSDFKDYYDCGMSTDREKEPLYIRKQIITFTDLKLYSDSQTNFNSPFHPITFVYKFHIRFCGISYCGAKISFIFK